MKMMMNGKWSIALLAISMMGCRSHKTAVVAESIESEFTAVMADTASILSVAAESELMSVEIDSVIRVGRDSSVTVARGVRAIRSREGRALVKEESRAEGTVVEARRDTIFTEYREGTPSRPARRPLGWVLIPVLAIAIFFAGRWSRGR